MTSPSVHHVRAALRWLRFARLAGARFDVEAKAADALAFCAEHDAAGFALPSALDGVATLAPYDQMDRVGIDFASNATPGAPRSVLLEW